MQILLQIINEGKNLYAYLSKIDKVDTGLTLTPPRRLRVSRFGLSGFHDASRMTSFPTVDCTRDWQHEQARKSQKRSH